MCIHYGDPDGPCPTCQDGCGQVTELYANTNRARGNIRGRHRKFIQGHQLAVSRAEAKETYESEQETILSNLLDEVLASGLTGDDMIRVFLSRKEVVSAILMAHLRSALNGNVQSTKLLFDRGLGTPKQGGKGVPKLVDLGFLNPLESVDEPYAEDE